MRIGILTSALGGGGAERQALIWADLCARAGHDVTAIVLWESEDVAAPEGVRVVHTPKGRFGALATIPRQLRRLQRDLDALVAFEPYLIVCAALTRPRIPWIAVTGKVPYLLTDRSRIPLPAFRRAFDRATLASAPNEAMVECHRRLGIRRDRPWQVVPNAADDDAFVASSGPRAGALWVGRFDPVKNPLLAVESAAAAGAPLTMLGYGILQPQIDAAVAALDGRPPIEIRPFSGKPWESYASHRVLVVTSHYESFGNVIVESLAAGTPVVSVDCDFGPRAIIGGASYSALVEPDAAAVATAVRRVLDRPYTAEEEAECRAIAEAYRPANVAPDIARAIERL